jgi:two-component system sensor histidine kinase TtrS
LKEALIRLDEEQFDVVMLDLGLPDSEGLETLQRLRKKAPQMPIVILTGLNDELLQAQALHQGAQDYLVKGEPIETMVARAIRYAIERKAAEELIRKNEAEMAHLSRVSTVGQMAAGLAHELNQPLGAILNYASVCLEQTESRKDLPPMLLEAMGEIMNETRRIGGIISRLRSFVRKQKPKAVPVDVNALVDESMNLLGFELLHKGIRPRLSLAEPSPMVLADPIHLEQVLVNLVYNALEAMDAMDQEEQSLTVQTKLIADGALLELSVIDNGPGVAPENMNRLFEAFFTTKSHGLGMGLNICRTIIESHGGRLDAARNPDGGMRFYFTLPLANGEPS